MNLDTKPRSMDANEEIPALIETLVATEQRLEELTGGEVDTVAGRDGRTFLLRRAQEQLRYSEAAKQAAILNELRVLFDMVPAMIWFKDTENGFLRVNKLGAAVTGRLVEEIEGKSAYDIFPQEAAGYYADDLEVIHSGVPKLGIVEKLRGSNGQALWVQTDKVPVLDKDGKVTGLVVMAQDISERKRDEEALRASQANMAAAQRLAHFGSWEMELAKAKDVDANLVRWSDEMFRIAGYEPGAVEVSNELFFRLVHPEDREPIRQGLATAIRERREYSIVHRLIRPDGETRVVQETAQIFFDETTGQPTKIVGTAHDITERKQAETALREIELRLAHAMSMAQLVAWEYDPATGLFTFDDRYYMLHGTTAELEGGNLMCAGEFARKFVHPDDASVVGAELGKAVTTTDPGYRTQLECRIFRRDGEPRLALVNISVTKDAAGRTIQIHGANQDITERKRIEVALRASEARFRFLNSLTEATRTLVDAEQIMAAISRMLGEHLRASRCAYADVENNGDQFTILHDYTAGCASTVGKYQLSLFGARAVAKLHSGQTLIVRDVDGELSSGEGADTFNAIGIHAIIACPLVKGGSLRAIMAVHQTTPRDWQATEVALVQEVVERCWATIERRRTEEALRASEAEFRALAEAMPHMVWITRPDGWNVYISQQWMDYTGLTLEESLGHGWNQPFHPEDQQHAWDAWQHATATGAVYSMESRLRRADGVYRWWLIRGVPQLDAAGNILKWFGTCTDIHDLKVAELEISRTNRELRESEEKFLQLADNVADVFYMTSPDMQQMHYISPAYERIWGRSVASLYTHPLQWAEAILPEERASAFDIFSRLATDAPSASAEYRISRPDGTVRWILSRGFQVRDATGKVIRITGIASDITERKLSEAALENAHKELVETSRHAGMAEVATGILHNVGNVLNSVNVSTGLLVEIVKKSRVSSLARVVVLLREHAHDLGEFIANDDRGKHVPAHLAQLSEHLLADQATLVAELDSLRGNVEHIKEIVAMQQNYATVGGVKEIINVVDLVEDSLRMNEGALNRHCVEIIREFGAVPPMNVEKHKIVQILVNLVRNAKYACDESNRVDKRLTVRVSNGDGRVKILVIDNGVGIPPENLTRIFSHGFTTRKDGHGFGLHSGALVAKEMGGSLTVHSDGPDQGATFTLELPCQSRENSHE